MKVKKNQNHCPSSHLVNRHELVHRIANLWKSIVCEFGPTEMGIIFAVAALIFLA